MTFAELLVEVYNITGRADLIDLTTSAVKAATLKAHQTDFYSKDLYEERVTFSTRDYNHSLDYVTLNPLYRAAKFIRKFDTLETEPGAFLTLLTVDEVLDEWGRERTDVGYIAGRHIEIKSSTEINRVILGYYLNPVIVEANYDSWIAALYPYAIVHEAARLVFASIAQDAEKNSQKTLVGEQYAILKINAVSDIGY